VLINSDRKTLIEKRIGAGIWQNLYQFPLLETNDTNIEIDENDVSSFLNHKGIQQIQSVIKYNDLPITHKLTHQHLEIIFWIVETTDLIRAGVKSDQLDDYPMPKALQNFREKFFMN
jgi:A/G-specific adenine glycosylase